MKWKEIIIKYTVEIDQYGNIKWYKEGTDILHRENGPAVELKDGSKFWYRDGLLHRDDGPAIEYSHGNKYWYKEGKCYREDGPAVVYYCGVVEYRLNDRQVTEKEFEDWKNKKKGFFCWRFEKYEFGRIL